MRRLRFVSVFVLLGSVVMLMPGVSLAERLQGWHTTTAYQIAVSH